MIISGIQKFTLLDFPGKVACIIFTGGCNFRCRFCHNPEFVLPELLAEISGSCIPEEAVLGFLRERQGMLEGVVISGGEPTVMPDLEAFIIKVRELGFIVKLDTNGNNPSMLKSLIQKGLVEYVAMDFKTSLSEYPALVGSWADAEKLTESIEILKTGGIEYEFRSTLIREFHTPAVLRAMQETLRGAKRWYLQSFRNGVTLDPLLKKCSAFSSDEMRKIAKQCSSYVDEATFRET